MNILDKFAGKRMGRNNEALWRQNDDGSILLFSESTGRAFILSEKVSQLWLQLEAEPSTEKLFSVINKKDEELFLSTIENMSKSGLIEIIDSDGIVMNQNHSIRKTKEISNGNITDLKNSDIDLSFFDEGSQGEFTEIMFGVCDCTSGWLGIARWWYECRDGSPAENGSVIT